jgi:hypothetical protein
MRTRAISLVLIPLVMLCLVSIGCTPIEDQAYKTIVGAKAFLDAEKAAHPECASNITATVCVDLKRATSSKDFLIDAAETYCAGPQFETGGACQPPAKGTPALTQATAKLKAAIAAYSQSATDLKGAL